MPEESNEDQDVARSAYDKINDESSFEEYSVEIAVHGTWRDVCSAFDKEEAEDFITQRVEQQLGLDSDNQWGDIAVEVVGTRKIEEE